MELQSEDDVSKALAHHNEHMGRRYVEMFRASRGQMEWECRKVYDGGEGVGGGGGEGSFGGGGTGGNGGVVRLRGLPYGCAEEEVRRFFTGWLSERRGCTVIVVVRLSILLCDILVLFCLHYYRMHVHVHVHIHIIPLHFLLANSTFCVYIVIHFCTLY